MESIRTHQPLNAAQMLLLQTFSQIKSEKSFEELQTVLLDFYQKKLDEETDKWWKANNMTPDKFESMCSNIHYRTPYANQ